MLFTSGHLLFKIIVLYKLMVLGIIEIRTKQSENEMQLVLGDFFLNLY